MTGAARRLGGLSARLNDILAAISAAAGRKCPHAVVYACWANNSVHFSLFVCQTICQYKHRKQVAL